MNTSPLKQSPLSNLHLNYTNKNTPSTIKNNITPKRNVNDEINKF